MLLHSLSLQWISSQVMFILKFRNELLSTETKTVYPLQLNWTLLLFCSCINIAMRSSEGHRHSLHCVTLFDIRFTFYEMKPFRIATMFAMTVFTKEKNLTNLTKRGLMSVDSWGILFSPQSLFPAPR